MPRKNKQQELQRVERLVRLDKLLKMRLSGVTSKREMSAALGVSIVTIYKDIDIIDKGWSRTVDDQKEMAVQRNLSDKQLSHLLHLSLVNHEISKQQEVETTTVTKEEKCDACKGRGIKPGTEDEWCETCGGDGTVKLEIVTQKQRGKDGDPAHLEVARKCIVDRCKLLGLVLDSKIKAGKDGGDQHLHLHEASNQPNQFDGISPDTMVELMSAMEKAKRESKQKEIVNVEGYNKEDKSKQGEKP